MLRAGAAVLLILLSIAPPGQAAVRALGSLDPVEAAAMVNYGVTLQNQQVSAALAFPSNTDVVLVTTEAEISPTVLRARIQDGLGAVVSNRLPATWFEGLGIKRGGIQLVNTRQDPGAPVVITFSGFTTSDFYPVRVYWPAANNPDTLYSLEPLSGTFDTAKRYGADTVVAGMAVGKGYLVIIPSAALRADSFYAQYDPASPTTRNAAFLADAIQQAYRRSAGGAASPPPAPTQAPTPPPAATPPPAPEPTPPPAATPPSTSPPTRPPSPAPTPPFPAGIALAALILVLVAVIVGVRMMKRKPPPAHAGVGMGQEEIPPSPPSPPPSDDPPTTFS